MLRWCIIRKTDRFCFKCLITSVDSSVVRRTGLCTSTKTGSDRVAVQLMERNLVHFKYLPRNSYSGGAKRSSIIYTLQYYPTGLQRKLSEIHEAIVDSSFKVSYTDFKHTVKFAAQLYRRRKWTFTSLHLRNRLATVQ